MSTNARCAAILPAKMLSNAAQHAVFAFNLHLAMCSITTGAILTREERNGTGSVVSSILFPQRKAGEIERVK